MSEEMELPNLTQEPVRHVDATPDDNYPIRILKVHRQHCDCNWAVSDGDPVFEAMNEDNQKRAKILDKAIEILKTNDNNERQKTLSDFYSYEISEYVSQNFDIDDIYEESAIEEHARRSLNMAYANETILEFLDKHKIIEYLFGIKIHSQADLMKYEEIISKVKQEYSKVESE